MKDFTIIYLSIGRKAIAYRNKEFSPYCLLKLGD
jgi:hypothetical protein